jgi:hypothetical protein
VVDDELAPSLEQVEQAGLAFRAVEDVVLVDPDHRQPAALGCQRISRPGGLLLLNEHLVARGLPLGFRNDSWKVHLMPPQVGRRPS